jgi:hypothetical protein
MSVRGDMVKDEDPGADKSKTNDPGRIESGKVLDITDLDPGVIEVDLLMKPKVGDPKADKDLHLDKSEKDRPK